MIDEGARKNLHSERKWKALVHYRDNLFGGRTSLVDDPRFFLSPEGKTDPKKELEATIKAFFSQELGDSHAQCRYVARFRWLSEELRIEADKLPRPDCKGLNELMEALKPESAVLIFPVAHINSPASMFGHTLLRIDSSAESKMFSYAVNYSAFTDETNGILFALRGILGFYEGYYAMSPYYEALKEYSDLENRDMWEYRLNFSKKEVEDLVLHMWELKDTYSYYYFFDENCSFNLLLALEAGRPSVDLIGSIPKWVIPLETIRAVHGNNLYGNELFFRPSKATKIRFIEAVTDPAHRALAQDIAEGRKSPEEASVSNMAHQDRIKTLDLSAEYLQYNYSKKRVEKDVYLRSYLRILSLRSALGKGSDYKIAAPDPPEAGHRPARFFIGAGVKRGASYTSIGLRPANHALMDPDEGYLEGASISFMDTEVRYNHTERKLSLERFTFVEVVSVSERSPFFKPISWKVNGAVEREEFAKREHRTNARLFGGPGLAYRAFGNALVYTFFEPEAKVGGDLEDGYAIGAGASLGFMKPFTKKWKTRIEARGVGFFAGDAHSVISAELNQRYTIKPSQTIMFGIKRERFDGYYSTGIDASFNLYF